MTARFFPFGKTRHQGVVPRITDPQTMQGTKYEWRTSLRIQLGVFFFCSDLKLTSVDLNQCPFTPVEISSSSRKRIKLNVHNDSYLYNKHYKKK